MSQNKSLQHNIVHDFFNICKCDDQWALIAGRVKAILGLALEYYSIQRTLCDGVAAPNTTARCQSDLERVERQFYECMVFLLRVIALSQNGVLIFLKRYLFLACPNASLQVLGF